jgi:hypothetical protein
MTQVRRTHWNGLMTRSDGIRRSQALAPRAIVRRGIDRGELAKDTPVTLLLDTLPTAP